MQNNKKYRHRKNCIEGKDRKECESKKSYFKVCLLTICILLGQGIVVSAAKTPVAAHGRLSVKGVDLIDAKGKKFQLRGISSHGINWDVGAPYVNKASFKTLRNDWGVNAVRLAMYTSEYNGYCAGGNKENLKKQVRNGIKYATDLGMYVIIDWHILKDGNPKKQLKEAKSFFDTMSVQYKNQKNVIYEICNEPNGCSWNTIRDYAEQIIKVIRQNDANAVIILGTPNWSQLGSEVSNHPIKGYKNIMYSLHFYANEKNTVNICLRSWMRAERKDWQ